MNKMKSAALTAFGTIIAVAALGFFASIGLAMIGGLFTIGALVALAGWISTFFAPRDVTTTAAT